MKEHRVSPSKFAQARARQQALTDSEWLVRCDELAIQQRIAFLELVTFGRDGATGEQTRAIIDYLSILQFIAAGESEAISSPVLMAEFRDAVIRSVSFFRSIETNDPRRFNRLMRSWSEGVAQRSEPVVWAGCIETLKQHGIPASPLFREMGVTLYAIADVYSRRFTGGTAPAAPPTRTIFTTRSRPAS